MLANIRSNEWYQTGLTEEEKREGERMARELIQAVEDELYPERENQESNKTDWIVKGGIATVLVIVAGSVIYLIFIKKRKK